ncbi:MAG: glutamate racemase [Desulfobulbaceae bacterium A2]|nr:MAG: glutamate racemase [Desulfobulbaceae bacterium A2]
MIGVFDSGVGGLTVARAIEQALPELPLVYFGDIARTPYGSKSPDTIRACSCRNTEFLLAQGAEILVIACNTAASVASDLLRRQYPVPVFEVITPAIEQALQQSARRRIGVIGTRATILSEVYRNGLLSRDPDSEVFCQACPLLVPLVEEDWLDQRETKMILRRYLHPLKRQDIDTLILGCTHYPLLHDLIHQRMGRRVRLIDSSRAVAARLADTLVADPVLYQRLRSTARPSRYYVSDRTEAAARMANRIFGRPMTLEKVEV